MKNVDIGMSIKHPMSIYRCCVLTELWNLRDFEVSRTKRQSKRLPIYSDSHSPLIPSSARLKPALRLGAG